ncbi:MAG: hypothetical protein ACLP1Y_14290 [Candidatus Acidiferrales bacterium]
MMIVSNRRYLGDGVYAQQERERIVLMTSDGLKVTNWIVLEPEVHRALLAYIQDVQRAIANSNAPGPE